MIWLEDFIEGLKDVSNLEYPAAFLLKSKDLRRKTAYCILLNGFIFIGSILAFNLFIHPILLKITFIPSILVSASPAMYMILWIMPLYLFSFVLNAFWYQDIADLCGSMVSSYRRPATPSITE